MPVSLNFRFLVSLAAGALLWACNPEGPLREQGYQGGALGTSYAIKLYTQDTTDLQTRIDSVFRVINQSLSTYLPDSDISRVNKGDSTLVVDQQFREVFRASGEIYERTGGFFDPTVGMLVDAWGFGPGPAMELDSLRVDSLLQFVGFDKVHLTGDHRIVKQHPSIRLDFNAIAKGYAIDRISAMLDRQGIRDYLVEVGGELRARGKNCEKGQDWRVGIDDPQETSGRSIKKIIAFTDRAMASSGNYRKFRIDSLTGQKYVHTVDPHTGFTRNANVLSATVLAPTCTVADGYATAFMAMDLGATRKLLSESPELEGYLIYLDGEGETREYMTPGFEALVR